MRKLQQLSLPAFKLQVIVDILHARNLGCGLRHCLSLGPAVDEPRKRHGATIGIHIDSCGLAHAYVFGNFGFYSGGDGSVIYGLASGSRSWRSCAGGKHC